MLRITRNERAKLYQTNARIRRKMRNLKNTYNITTNFNFMTPSQFKTRAEVNEYKRLAKEYLNPYNHRYVKGGLKRPDYKYYYPIPYSEYREIMRHIHKQNEVARRLMKKAEKIRLYNAGKRQAETVASFIDRRKEIESRMLGGRFQMFIPIKFKPETISSTKTLQNFKYAIKSFNTREYYNRQGNLARDNMIDALYNTFGANAEPICRLLETLTNEEFNLLYQSEEYIDFDYIYSPEHATRLLQGMASGILHFIADANVYQRRNLGRSEFLDIINDLKEMQDIDSAKILAEYNPHGLRLYYNGKWYKGTFRTKEMDTINRAVQLTGKAQEEAIHDILFNEEGNLRHNIRRE